MTGARPPMRRPAAGSRRIYAPSPGELREDLAVGCAGSASLSSPAVIVDRPPSNIARFLDAATPSLPPRYLPETRTRTRSARDTGSAMYFTLEELWRSFEEWSAYGAGVPLVLGNSESVVQYYVPSISGIQLYGASSSGRNDYEHESGWCGNASEGFSIDGGEAGTSAGCLLFHYFEHSPPYCREPFASKISNLAQQFPELWTLRSCDLSPDSWMSVAWYPIYRIPTGAALSDFDACFLTFHLLSTSTEGAHMSTLTEAAHPLGVNGISRIQLPIFGMASYKLKGSLWLPYGGGEKQFLDSLQQAADTWLQVRQVDHPDYRFFASNGRRR